MTASFFFIGIIYKNLSYYHKVIKIIPLRSFNIRKVVTFKN